MLLTPAFRVATMLGSGGRLTEGQVALPASSLYFSSSLAVAP